MAHKFCGSDGVAKLAVLSNHGCDTTDSPLDMYKSGLLITQISYLHVHDTHTMLELTNLDTISLPENF